MSSSRAGPRVTLYGVDWCPWVVKARRWLEGNGVDYRMVTVPDDQRERREVVEVSGQFEVPVIVVEDSGRKHVFLEETHPELPELLGL